MRFRKKRERIAFSQQLLEFLRYYAHTRPPPINIHKIPAESNLASTCLSCLGVPRWRGSGCRGIARPFYKQEQGRRASVQLRLLTVTESEPFGLPSLTSIIKPHSMFYGDVVTIIIIKTTISAKESCLTSVSPNVIVSVIVRSFCRTGMKGYFCQSSCFHSIF